MLGEFFAKLFGKESGSGAVAKDRLRLVLLHDRASISPQMLESLKMEMIVVITKHLIVDEANLEVSLDSSGDTVALIANIPVKGMKRAAGQ